MTIIARRLLLCALAALLACPAASAAQTGEGAENDSGPASAARGERSYDGAAGQLRVEAPQIGEAELNVDGVLDERAWERAAVLHGFTQYEPSEGIPAVEETEVLVLVTDDAIHFGVRARDTGMDRIRATLGERDGFTRSDDYVRFVLDTFDDQRKAYVFSVNPYGVQHDGLWIEGGGDRRGFGPPIDSNPDFIWESDARMHGDGWTAEVRIPFKTLRFPELARQDWGFNVVRAIKRRGFEQSWAPITGDVANQLSQAGRIVGLQDLDPGMFLEVNPVATGKRVGTFREEAGELVHDDFEQEFGVNVTYGLTSNLTLDGTVNPDFSQVEADAGQIAVNERFALFFPEKRPFFLEGTEIFSLPKRLIYTRTIADPVAGAKLTGKVGSLNVGYLGAVDDFEDADDVLVNIVRARQDVGASSTVGGLYTDRTRSGDDYNRVGGLDARLVLGRRYTVTLLGARSWTADPAASDVTTGGYLVAGLERAGRAFSFSAELEDADEDFRAGSGFLRRIGDTQVESQVRVNRFGDPEDFVEEVGVSAEARGFWSHDDFWAGEAVEEGQLQLSGNVSLRNNITVFGTWTRSLFDFDPAAYDGLFVVPEDGPPEPFRPDQDLFGGLDGFRLFAFFSNWEKVRGNARLEWEQSPIFDRRAGVPVEPGEVWSADLSLDFFPTAHLGGALGLRHETISRGVDGSHYSSATIPRLRVQYQFSRSLFVRTIFEYSAQEREPVRDPATGARIAAACDPGCDLREGSDANDIHVEGLLAYEPSPGTVFFLGYTRDMEETRAFRFDDVEPRAEGLFVKASYRLRF